MAYPTQPYMYQQVYQPPMYTPQNRTVINPYQDQLSQLQQYSQYQTPIQTQFAQPMMQQIPYLAGQIVDGIDAVKAKDVDMTGSKNYYPQSNGEFIFTKQLQADGTSQTLIYKLIGDLNSIQNQQQAINQPQESFEKLLRTMLGQVKAEIINEISALIPTQANGFSTQRKGQDEL